MGKLLQKLKEEKPWAIMGLSRAQYEKAKPWKGAKVNRENFEKLVRICPPETLQVLREEAEAEALVEAMFGKGVLAADTE